MSTLVWLALDDPSIIANDTVLWPYIVTGFDRIFKIEKDEQFLRFSICLLTREKKRESHIISMEIARSCKVEIDYI